MNEQTKQKVKIKMLKAEPRYGLKRGQTIELEICSGEIEPPYFSSRHYAT